MDISSAQRSLTRAFAAAAAAVTLSGCMHVQKEFTYVPPTPEHIHAMYAQAIDAQAAQNARDSAELLTKADAAIAFQQCNIPHRTVICRNATEGFYKNYDERYGGENAKYAPHNVEIDILLAAREAKKAELANLKFDPRPDFSAVVPYDKDPDFMAFNAALSRVADGGSFNGRPVKRNKPDRASAAMAASAPPPTTVSAPPPQPQSTTGGGTPPKNKVKGNSGDHNPQPKDDSCAPAIELVLGAYAGAMGVIFRNHFASADDTKKPIVRKFGMAALEIGAPMLAGAAVKLVATHLLATAIVATLPGFVGLMALAVVGGVAAGVTRALIKNHVTRRGAQKENLLLAATLGGVFGLAGGMLASGAEGLWSHFLGHGKDAMQAAAQHGAKAVKQAVVVTTRAAQSQIASTASAATVDAAAATGTDNVASLLSADQLHSLTPDLQKMALSQDPVRIAKFAELAAQQLMHGHAPDSDSFQQGVKLLKYGANAGKGYWSHLADSDLARMSRYGFGMEKSKDIALSYAKRVTGTMGKKLMTKLALG